MSRRVLIWATLTLGLCFGTAILTIAMLARSVPRVNWYVRLSPVLRPLAYYPPDVEPDARPPATADLRLDEAQVDTVELMEIREIPKTIAGVAISPVMDALDGFPHGVLVHRQFTGTPAMELAQLWNEQYYFCPPKTVDHIKCLHPSYELHFRDRRSKTLLMVALDPSSNSLGVSSSTRLQRCRFDGRQLSAAALLRKVHELLPRFSNDSVWELPHSHSGVSLPRSRQHSVTFGPIRTSVPLGFVSIVKELRYVRSDLAFCYNRISVDHPNLYVKMSVGFQLPPYTLKEQEMEARASLGEHLVWTMEAGLEKHQFSSTYYPAEQLKLLHAETRIPSLEYCVLAMLEGKRFSRIVADTSDPLQVVVPLEFGPLSP